VNLLWNRKNFTLISKTHCISQAFLCLIIIFHKALNLRDISGRFNAVSMNISHKTHKSTKSPIVLQNHLANVQKNQMSLSNDIMQLINRISKFSCCLYSVKILCIRSDSVLRSRLCFAKYCHVCRCNTFKQKTAVWNLRSCSLFYFVQSRTEKLLQLTKGRLFVTSRVLFGIGVVTFLSYCH